jgi:hypothetical protein
MEFSQPNCAVAKLEIAQQFSALRRENLPDGVAAQTEN